jgi:hypothetical protein
VIYKAEFEFSYLTVWKLRKERRREVMVVAKETEVWCFSLQNTVSEGFKTDVSGYMYWMGIT